MIDNQLIYKQNPWWQRVESIEEDPRIAVLRTLPLVWNPPFILDMEVNSDAVHIITGPRQVGKSTAVRLSMRDLLLKKGADPKNFLLFNCDIVSSPRELAELVLYFLDNVAVQGRKYIFLDEISAVEDWPNGIKWLIDQGKGDNCTYILTGSSSIKLKKSGEFMPARRGAGKDIILHPLSFREYVELAGSKLPACDIFQSSFREIQKFQSDVLLKIPNIAELFRRYCLHGGFLKPINELHQKAMITTDTVDVYLSWFKSETAKDKKREQVARIVLEKVCKSLGTGLSYQALAEHMDVGSHNTARAYLDFFIDSFILHEIPFAEISQGRVAWRKNRKYYFSDPFLYWLSLLWNGGGDNIMEIFNKAVLDSEKMGPVMENIVEVHLGLRGLSPYYGAVRGQEIDFAVLDQDIGIEVKFQKRITPSDAAAIKGFKNAVLISQDTLQEIDSIKVVPAYLFCMM